MNPLKKSILLAFFWILGCSHSDNLNHYEPFVGHWVITEAASDTMDQPEWKGLNLDIFQTSEKGGTYSLPDSPYDSIWSSAGQWSSQNKPDSFIRDNNLQVTCFKSNDVLQLYFVIPVIKPCNPPEPCLAVVYGNWLFNLKKR